MIPCQCKDCKKNPTFAQERWAEWIEYVFWSVSGCLKHGGFLVPELTELEEYSDLYLERTHKIGGDDLHAMREQIFVEYNIPAMHEKLWPTQKPKRKRRKAA